MQWALSRFIQLLWFTPSWQLSTTQPLSHCPPTSGVGERVGRLKLMACNKDSLMGLKRKKIIIMIKEFEYTNQVLHNMIVQHQVVAPQFTYRA